MTNTNIVTDGLDAERIAPDIDLFTEQDVERLLFESAPIRARRDVPGVAV